MTDGEKMLVKELKRLIAKYDGEPNEAPDRNQVIREHWAWWLVLLGLVSVGLWLLTFHVGSIR
jgi:hypothetical protein